MVELLKTKENRELSETVPKSQGKVGLGYLLALFLAQAIIGSCDSYRHNYTIEEEMK